MKFNRLKFSRMLVFRLYLRLIGLLMYCSKVGGMDLFVVSVVIIWNILMVFLFSLKFVRLVLRDVV